MGLPRAMNDKQFKTFPYIWKTKRLFISALKRVKEESLHPQSPLHWCDQSNQADGLTADLQQAALFLQQSNHSRNPSQLPATKRKALPSEPQYPSCWQKHAVASPASHTIKRHRSLKPQRSQQHDKGRIGPTISLFLSVKEQLLLYSKRN